MEQHLIRHLLIFGLAVPVSFLIDRRKSVRYWYALTLFIILGIADNLLLLTNGYPELQIISYHMWGNFLGCAWSAKIYSIVVFLVLVFPLRRIISAGEIGLTFRQNRDTLRFSWAWLAVLFIMSLVLGFLGKKGPFDTKVLLYMAILPGLNEELVYRGFLLGFLNKLFETRFTVLGTSFGWGAILTTLVFALLHAFFLSDMYRVSFNITAFLFSGCLGFIFALLRERSGSLVFPVIAHGIVDFFTVLMRMV